MSALSQTICELQTQRNRAEREVEKLGVAIKALESLGGSVAIAGTTKRTWKMSASARRRIALAQKARWAKWKAQKK